MSPSPPPPQFHHFLSISTTTSTSSSSSPPFHLLLFSPPPPPPFSSPPPPPPQFRHFLINSTSSSSSPPFHLLLFRHLHLHLHNFGISSPILPLQFRHLLSTSSFFRHLPTSILDFVISSPSLRPPPSPQFCHLLSSSSFSSPPPHLHLHKFVTSFRPPLLHSLLMSAPPFHFSHLFPFRHLLHLLHLLLFREVLPYLLLFITSIFLISSSPLHLYLHYLKFVTSSHLLVFIITSLSSSPSPFPYAFPPPRFLLYLLHLLLFRHLLLHLPLVPFLLRPPPRKRVTERGGLPRAWWRGVTRD